MKGPPNKAWGPRPKKVELLPEETQAPAKRPRIGGTSTLITLFAFAIAVTPEFNFLGIPKVRVTDLIIPLILLATMGNPPIRQPGKKPRTFPLTSIFVAVLAWDTCSLLVFGDAGLRPGAFYLVKRLLFFLAAYMGYAAVDCAESFNKIIRGLLWASPILCLSVLYEARTKSEDASLSGDALRASGIIGGQQASTALFIIIVILLSMGLWPVTENKTPLLGSILLGIAAVFATGTKGAMLSGGLGLLVISLMPGRARIPIHYLIIPLILGWLVLPDRLRDRLTGVSPEISQVYAGLYEDASLMPSTGSSSLANRVVTAQGVIQDLLPRASLLGLGTGYKSLGTIDNFYLTEWVYHGAVGLFLFLLLLFKLFKLFLISVKKIRAPIGKAAATGMVASLAAMTLGGLHSDSFYLIRPMECLMLLTGVVIGRNTLED